MIKKSKEKDIDKRKTKAETRQKVKWQSYISETRQKDETKLHFLSEKRSIIDI